MTTTAKRGRPKGGRAVYICGLGAVCSSWGKYWKRHWYNKETGECYRCGTPKK